MELEDIKKLAILARVDMDEEEMKKIGDSFGPILSYVGQIKEVSESLDRDNQYQEVPDEPINVFREDIATNKRGEFTDKILSEMPDTESGFLKVKQIL